MVRLAVSKAFVRIGPFDRPPNPTPNTPRPPPPAPRPPQRAPRFDRPPIPPPRAPRPPPESTTLNRRGRRSPESAPRPPESAPPFDRPPIPPPRALHPPPPAPPPSPPLMIPPPDLRQGPFPRARYQEADAGDATSQGVLMQTDVEEANYEREKRFKYLSIYLPLYQAGLKGDWHSAKAILDKYPDAVRVPITEDNQYILHIATLAKRYSFVKELLELMTRADLELKDTDGNTALYFAAASGIVKIAEEMVEKNKELPLIRCEGEKILPLYVATLLQNRDMVSYLFSATPFEQLTATDRIDLLFQTISADFYDIALDILKKDPTLATAEDSKGRIALGVLAGKPFAVGSRSRMSTWERSCNSWYKECWNKAVMRRLAHQLIEVLWKNIQTLPDKQFLGLVDKHSSLLFVAAELGNVEFLTILLRSHPDLIWKRDRDERSLFHISVINRQESVFNLIYEIGALKDTIALMVDKYDNNMLHIAGRLAPKKRLKVVSGAVLQMQRELLWFKEIEKITPPAYLHLKNIHCQTPQDIFVKAHEDLQSDGETWMKETANYCMLVATLIVTVVFAAAYTVPGGNNQDNGTPIFLESKWFTVFFISDVIAFLSSSTSILIFFSTILTSRYKEEDFLKSLPGRLVFGLTALFISIVGMVVAFCATCFLVYQSKTISIPTVIIALAGLPIILFVWLIYDLWFDIIRSTYWSRFLFQPHKHGLFQQVEASDPNKPTTDQ